MLSAETWVWGSKELQTFFKVVVLDRVIQLLLSVVLVVQGARAVYHIVVFIQLAVVE
jgi:hypothetical protein